MTPNVHQQLQQYYKDNASTKHDVKIQNLENITVAHERVYQLLKERTGLRVKEVDELLSPHG